MWRELEKELLKLLANNDDLKITTAELYVIGYLCESLDEKELLSQVNLSKLSSGCL